MYNNCSYYNPEIVQAGCKKFETDISELKNRLKTQETETRKANAKFEFSVAAQEELKKKFETERKTWAEEGCSGKPGRTGGEGSDGENRRTLRLKAPCVTDGRRNLR